MSILRIAQGLLSMGKGSLTLNPQLSNKLLLSNTSLAGLLITILSLTEAEGLIYGKYQYLLYSLCLAMRPRMVMTLTENLEPKSIHVTVGQAVDTVGMPGNPRNISGYQVNNTPLLITAGERCELNNDDYISETSILEDVVIIHENLEKRNKN